MSVKLTIGIISYTICFIAIILNLLICSPVFRLAFVSKKSTVYIIAFVNLMSDLCQLLITFFYLSLSVIGDGYVFTENRTSWINLVIVTGLLIPWYVGCLIQVVMAVNRFTIITLNKHDIFTYRRTIIIHIFVIAISTCTAIAYQYLIPCCSLIWEPMFNSFTYVLEKDVHNYSDNIQMFYNIFCSSIPILCYSKVFITLRQSGKLISTKSNYFITEFIPPFIPIVNDYAVASGYNLLGCNIRKSMSQLNYNILCYLNNTEGYLQHNLSLSDTWKIDRKSCDGITWKTFNPLFNGGKLDIKDFTKFAFVRDPEERFASFYLDKCKYKPTCWNCTTPRCVIKMIYDTLIQVSKNQTNITKDDKKMWLEWHIAPQTWNCDFNQFLNDYHFIPIGTSLEQRKEAMRKLRRVLDFARIPNEHIDKIISDMETSDTSHATYQTKKSEKVMEEIKTDPYIRHYLHHTYYHDYVAFGFNMTGIVDFPQAPKILNGTL